MLGVEVGHDVGGPVSFPVSLPVSFPRSGTSESVRLVSLSVSDEVESGDAVSGAVVVSMDASTEPPESVVPDGSVTVEPHPGVRSNAARNGS